MDKNDFTIRLGRRLRKVRQQRDLSLEELALLTHVSKPMLGQIERGLSNPTVATLWKIASALKVPFTTFVAEEPMVQLARAAEQTVLYEDNRRFQVYNIFALPGTPVELFRIKLMPGCRRFSEPHAPGVIESITVSSGAMTILVNETEYELRAGDSFQFAADTPHSYENRLENVCWAHMAIIYR